MGEKPRKGTVLAKLSIMETLRQAFVRDHHRLLALAAAVIRELDAGRRPEAEGALTSFARRLRTHIRIEEEVVFPAVESLVQDASYEPTRTLRREHNALRKLLGEVEGALVLGELGAAHGTLSELAVMLKLHEQKEERVLYPMVDRGLESSTIVELASLLTSP